MAIYASRHVRRAAILWEFVWDHLYVKGVSQHHQTNTPLALLLQHVSYLLKSITSCHLKSFYPPARWGASTRRRVVHLPR